MLLQEKNKPESSIEPILEFASLYYYEKKDEADAKKLEEDEEIRILSESQANMLHFYNQNYPYDTNLPIVQKREEVLVLKIQITRISSTLYFLADYKYD